MPNLRVFDPINRNMANDPSDSLYLTLMYAPEGRGIDCVVVDESGQKRGDNAKLFRITSAGTLQRFKNVDPSFGFELDGNGAIVLHS